MNDLATAIADVRSELAASADEIFPDLCDVVEIGKVDDGHSGHTTGETAIASNIPCKFDEVPASQGPIIGGGGSYQATHRIKFPATNETMAIKPSHILKIQANDNHEEMRFEMPVRARGSMAVFVTVTAKLTTGHREPTNV